MWFFCFGKQKCPVVFGDTAIMITISSKNDGDKLIVTIEDKGSGIDYKSQKQVFEKYFRVQSGNIHDVKGFGLGLSYVKLMVRAFKGEVRLESEPGSGTKVILEFPILR